LSPPPTREAILNVGEAARVSVFPNLSDTKDLPSFKDVQALVGILPNSNNSHQASPQSSSFVKAAPNALALARDGFKGTEINAGKTAAAVDGMIKNVIEFRSLTGGALGSGKVNEEEEEVTKKQLDLPPPQLPLTLPAAEKDTRDELPKFHYARTTRLGL
ncbi:MAG: hypothetical protein K940chlam5_01129, partial [Candidatus Anoxychlamydiales bacterium]|nr:hypothetical protein [Candidatus Anoxychlamydiales bacterium]